MKKERYLRGRFENSSNGSLILVLEVKKLLWVNVKKKNQKSGNIASLKVVIPDL